MTSMTCRVDDCNREIRLQRDQLCHAHYMQQRAGKPFTKPQTRIPAQGMECQFDGCDKPVRSGGLCSAHYTQKRLGKPLKPLAGQVKCDDRDEQGRKRCARCKDWQDEANFGNERTTADGLMRWCRGCMAEKSKARHESGARRNADFGLRPGQYDELVKSQGGRCAICATDNPGERAWAVDHDHKCCPGRKACGKCVRGLLCHKCNLALGLVNDDAEILNRMTEYLTTHAR